MSPPTTMIVYARTERTGMRRLALVTAVLVLGSGAWWLWGSDSSPEASTEAVVRASASAMPQAPRPLPGDGALVVPPPAAAVSSSMPLSLPSAIATLPSVPGDAAVLPIPAAAEPQLPSSPNRGEHDTEG